MEPHLPLHFRMFNEKVRLMNQLNQKSITLTASEARSLHADIFELLNQFSATVRTADSRPDGVYLDGGKF